MQLNYISIATRQLTSYKKDDSRVGTNKTIAVMSKLITNKMTAVMANL